MRATVTLPPGAAANGRGELVLGFRLEALDLAPDGLPAEVELVEEIGADAYVFCVAEVAGEATKLVARADFETPPARGARRAEASIGRGASLRPGNGRADRGRVSRPGARFSRRDPWTQPEALARLVGHAEEYERVAAEIARRDPAVVRLVGHGSSDAAASYGVYALGVLPNLTALRDSISLTVYYDAPVPVGDSVVIALSQSGQTPDVVEYVSRMRARGAYTVAVTNDPRSALAAVAEATLPLAAGSERAVAASKTYMNQLGALALLAGGAAGRGRRTLEGLRRVADQLAASSNPSSSSPARRHPRSRTSRGCS